MGVLGICQFFGQYFGDLNKIWLVYSIFYPPNGDSKIQFLIEKTTVTVTIQEFDYGVTVIFEKINGNTVI